MPSILARRFFPPPLPTPPAGRVSWREMWTLVWPQLLTLFFQFLVGLTDVWVAGKIHRDVQAALGLVIQCQFILLLVGLATANASVAAMSQSLGAGLPERARRYAGLILKLGLVFFLAVLPPALIFGRPLLHLLQVPEEIFPLTLELWSWYLAALLPHYLLAMTGAMFRARKFVLVPLATAFMAFACNAAASTGLGLGWWGLPNLGARGIACATILSVSAMALFNLAVLIRRKVITRASFAPLAWDKKALPYLLKVALPAGGMQLSWQLGYMVLFAVVASLPLVSVNALAGMAAGMRVESILFLPAAAFSMTGSVLVGHCLGAGNKAEAKRVGWRLILAGSGSMTLAALALWPFLADIAAVIAPDSGAQADALTYLRYNVLATPFSVASMCLGGILTGAGAAKYTFFVFGTAVWGVRLPLAFGLGHLAGDGAAGVFLAMFCSQVFQASVILYIFQTRDWARFAMIRRRPGHDKERL